MPNFTRQLPAANQILVSGATVGIDGTVFKLDVTEGFLTIDGGLTDDTGAGDAYRKWLTYGNAWAVGMVQLRGWLLGDNTSKVGVANVGVGTELDMTLTLMNTHTVPGKFVNRGMRLGVAKRSKRGVALWGAFSSITEVNS